MPVSFITFLSDYGLADNFVGVVHGVIAQLAPEARVIDLGHGVPRHDIRAGALLLLGALPFTPAGVHLAVVDPDVGAERRAVALRTADEPERLLVGPDNGLLIPAATAFGGIVEAIEVSRSPVRLEPVSATFHGRDVFAPVAASLVTGTPLGALGDPVDPAELVGLEIPVARAELGRFDAQVVYVDAFGNLTLGAGHDALGAAGLRLGRPVVVTADTRSHAARVARTFADVRPGELILYEDPQRRLALAVAHGSAADALGIGPGAEVTIADTP